uniref:Uncharacterized protein n=1 Tax=Timema genevievae TaxID=629358 RepID=A0A7R9KBG9_TIMGE|nr:unnamed protein product [Timema genevievae]
MAEHTYMRPNDVSPSSRFNGKINGVEGKTPFLIGVAGGTASGKVFAHRHSIVYVRYRTSIVCFSLAMLCYGAAYTDNRRSTMVAA